MVATDGAVDADGGAEIGSADVADMGRDLAIAAVVEDVGTVEIDAAVGFGRMERYGHFAAAMDADPGNGRARGAAWSAVPVCRLAMPRYPPRSQNPAAFRGRKTALGSVASEPNACP